MANRKKEHIKTKTPTALKWHKFLRVGEYFYVI